MFNTILRIISNIVFFIQILLVFLLLFEDNVTLPPWLQTVGRMHPLLLHLPIGLLVLAALLWIFRSNFETSAFRAVLGFILHVAALVASMTALMGFFLSKEEGYSDELLSVHKWTGIAVSFFCYGLLLMHQFWPQKRFAFTLMLAVTIPLLVVAGHYGASLTHGDDYIFQPMMIEPAAEASITDSTPIFAGVIHPIFKAKCYSCHNEGKAKGGLVMTSVEKLLKGGKSGPLWISGNAAKSQMIQQFQLPIDDKKHMPPEGRPQLTATEFDLLYAWVQSGADLKKAYRDFDEDDTLAVLLSGYIRGNEARQQYAFAAADPSVISRLNDPFRSVQPIAHQSPALKASLFIRQSYNRKKIEELSVVKDQLVELNLSNMPVKDEDVKVIATFTNLKKLNLNNTDITGESLVELSKLKNLNTLSVTGTQVDENISSAISLFPALKEIYVWNTGIDSRDAAALQEQFQKIRVNSGFEPDKNEILKLTPPIIGNDHFILTAGESIAVKHALPGVVVRYTLDGSEPDSTSSPIFKQPIQIDRYTVFKTRAVRDGWLASDVKEQAFFKKGFKPEGVEVHTKPESDQKGEGSKTLHDGLKGFPDLVKNKAWIGFRNEPLIATFDFGARPPVVGSITLGHLVHVGAMVFPPVSVEVWGGNDKDRLKMVGSVTPAMAGEKDKNRNAGVYVPIKPSNFRYYKIVAKPLARLPRWHYGKGQKAWILVDEVFFNDK